MYKYLNFFLFIFFLLISCNNNTQNKKFYGTDISQENIGKDFLLNSTQNKKISLKNTQTSKINILIFGYTNCPDICPTHIINYANSMKILKNNKNIQLYFLTLDPKRDTKEVLQNYLKYFNKSFIGLIPTNKELIQIKKNWKIVSYKTNKSSNNYLINHSTGAYILINDKAKLYQPYNLNDKQIANDINILINNYIK